MLTWTSLSPPSLKGHENFSELGVVRRKPSRGDSSPTLSKSCSDKLALKQCTSLLDSRTLLFISPVNAYLNTLVLPRSQCILPACARAFGSEGRMGPVVTKHWPDGHSFHAFSVASTDIGLPFSQEGLHTNDKSPKGSNISAVWGPEVDERLTNGVVQGWKQTNPRGASAISRKRMWDLAVEILAMLRHGPSEMGIAVQQTLDERRCVKEDVCSEALKGWLVNEDDGFERPAI